VANFNRRQKGSKLYWLPAVAGTSPTSGEMAAKTDLSVALNAMSGMAFTNSRIPVPVLASTFTPQITGEDTVSDTTLTFLDNDTNTTIRTALAKGNAGFLVRCPYGDATGRRCEVWPALSGGVNDEWSIGNDPARFAVDIAITAPPTLNATLP
jgi:hypothetical protein